MQAAGRTLKTTHQKKNWKEIQFQSEENNIQRIYSKTRTKKWPRGRNIHSRTVPVQLSTGAERSSGKERRVDALALRADERRDKLR